MIYKITFIVALWHCAMAVQCTWCKEEGLQCQNIGDEPFCESCRYFHPGCQTPSETARQTQWEDASSLCGPTAIEQGTAKRLRLGLGSISIEKAKYIAELIVFDEEGPAPEIWFYDAQDRSTKGSIWLGNRSNLSVNGIDVTEGKIKFTDLTARAKSNWNGKTGEPPMLRFEKESSGWARHSFIGYRLVSSTGTVLWNYTFGWFWPSRVNYRYLDISTDYECDVAVAFKHLSKCGPLRGLPEKVGWIHEDDKTLTKNLLTFMGGSVVLILLVLLAIGGAVWFFLFREPSDDDELVPDEAEVRESIA